jgi:hypothetical protein
MSSFGGVAHAAGGLPHKKKRRAALRQPWVDSNCLFAVRSGVAAAKAAALVAEADVTAAAVLAASFQAFANRTQDVAAFGVATAAGDRAAAFDVLALALGTAEIEAANLDAVANAAAGAALIANGIAQALHIAAVERVVAAATDAKATHELFEREFTRYGVLHIELGRTTDHLFGGQHGRGLVHNGLQQGEACQLGYGDQTSNPYKG